jgi:hypothetical protein
MPGSIKPNWSLQVQKRNQKQIQKQIQKQSQSQGRPAKAGRHKANGWVQSAASYGTAPRFSTTKKTIA